MSRADRSPQLSLPRRCRNSAAPPRRSDPFDFGHPMAFFRNRTVNLLNLHYGIHTVAMSGGGAFFAIYLLKAGVSLPGVLITLALILVGRFVLRPLVIVFAVRLGLRMMVGVGTLLSALQY